MTERESASFVAGFRQRMAEINGQATDAAVAVVAELVVPKAIPPKATRAELVAVKADLAAIKAPKVIAGLPAATGDYRFTVKGIKAASDPSRVKADLRSETSAGYVHVLIYAPNEGVAMAVAARLGAVA